MSPKAQQLHHKASKAMGPAKRTLFEAESAQGPPPKTRLRKTNTDDIVTKALHDNLKDMSHMETDCVQVNGVTLREKVTADKHAQRQGNCDIKFGKKYYAALRDEYRQKSGTGTVELAITNYDEVIGDGLFNGIKSWKGKASNRQALTSWLALSTEVPNQKEFVGVARVFLDLRPSATVDQSRVAVEIMRWIARLGLNRVFPAEVAMLKDQFDATLVQVPSSKCLWKLSSHSIRIAMKSQAVTC